jgi:hypothetical protein
MDALAPPRPPKKISLPSPCTNAEYEAAMLGAVEAAREAGVEAVAFGDIFLEDVRWAEGGGPDCAGRRTGLQPPAVRAPRRLTPSLSPAPPGAPLP